MFVCGSYRWPSPKERNLSRVSVRVHELNHGFHRSRGTALIALDEGRVAQSACPGGSLQGLWEQGGVTGRGSSGCLHERPKLRLPGKPASKAGGRGLEDAEEDDRDEVPLLNF